MTIIKLINKEYMKEESKEEQQTDISDIELENNGDERNLETHQKIINIYKGNPEIRKHIKNFLKTERGIRPIAIQKRYPKFKKPIVWYPRNSNTFLDISKTGIKMLQETVGEMHFFECIFDDNIKNYELINQEIEQITIENPELYEKHGITAIRSIVYNKHIIGMSPCFDIDSPTDPKTNKKTDCFEIWDRFMFIKQKIEKYLDDLGFEYQIVFSGNGIYIIMEECYFRNYDEFLEFVDEINNIIIYINWYADQYYKYKIHPNIDKKSKSWWNYDKTVFTYQSKSNRMTIYLPKGYVDKEYVKRITNIDTFTEHHVEYTKEIMDKITK